MSDEYYDISVSACGFLNRVRTVEQTGGQSYLACTFAALRGAKGGAKGERAEPTYFDAKVVGEHTRALLTQYQSVINDRSRQVFAAVRLSDLYVTSFVRQKGERKGETGFSLKSRLLAVESLAIDGVVVYRRAEDPTAPGARRGERDAQTGSANASPASPAKETAGAEPPAGFRGKRASETRP